MGDDVATLLLLVLPALVALVAPAATLALVLTDTTELAILLATELLATELAIELLAGGAALEDPDAALGCVPRGTTLPPSADEVPSEEVVMAAAAATYMARLSLEEGGLTTPAMPDWQ